MNVLMIVGGDGDPSSDDDEFPIFFQINPPSFLQPATLKKASLRVRLQRKGTRWVGGEEGFEKQTKNH